MRDPVTEESRKRVLIVDDEAGIRDSLRLLLRDSFEVTTAEDGRKGLKAFEENSPDLVILDVMMPELDGLETLRLLREKNKTVPVIMLSAVNAVKTAVEAMKCGAVDYLNKPFDFEQLTSIIVNVLHEAPALKEAFSSPVMVIPQGDFGPMVGRSQLMKDVFTRVAQVAEHDATVLITGESGTGKELVARRIHELSRRKSGPFVALNCAAIPESLIESELFGHEKGAFTHAIERRLGHFELADGGTLFLDEIGELSLQVQVKLLRFLQEREFYRVGRSKPIHVDVRVMTATNKHLETLIQENKFRQDLFYRINVINIVVPALRDRFEDIAPLVEYFIKKLSPLYGGRVISVAHPALEVMVQYSWPGNVRELENVVESLLALSPHDEIVLDDLPRKICQDEHKEQSLRFHPEGLNFEEAERLFESDMILKALKKTNYVQTRAAELLGISRRILKYKMDKLGIRDTPDPSDEKPEEPKGSPQRGVQGA